MAEKPAKRPGARERLLDAADQLFYEEGISTVGIDRVIAEAGVAKGSLYYVFGSKDELVRAYLHGRSQRWQRLVAEALPERYLGPRERLLGIFDLLGESFLDPAYCGCPFINASAEAPAEGVVREATDAHRAWIRETLADLGRAAGAADPEALAAQLALLYDGALVAAHLDRDPEAGRPARRAAEALVEAALAGR